MRALLPVALALAACATESTVDADVDYAQVIWKSATPVAVRASDLRQCELAAIGATEAMPQQQIIAAAQVANPGERRDRLETCLRARGYRIADFRVCTPEDRAAGPLRPILSVDALPPADQVRCYAPDVYGFIPL